jgi:hypothetical protein
MVSTYYIYYIVTTYYVVNGITIIKYLHTVNPHNGGKAWNMSRPRATGKRGLGVAISYAIETHGAISIHGYG